MSKELDFIRGNIAKLEDDYQHYTMCEKDEVKAFLIKCDINEYQAVEQALERKEKLEKAFEILKKNCVIEFDDRDYVIHLKDDKDQEWDYTILFIENKEDYDLLKEILK